MPWYTLRGAPLGAHVTLGPAPALVTAQTVGNSPMIVRSWQAGSRTPTCAHKPLHVYVLVAVSVLQARKTGADLAAVSAAVAAVNASAEGGDGTGLAGSGLKIKPEVITYRSGPNAW
jgi:hypothetical protein